MRDFAFGIKHGDAGGIKTEEAHHHHHRQKSGFSRIKVKLHFFIPFILMKHFPSHNFCVVFVVLEKRKKNPLKSIVSFYWETKSESNFWS